MRRRSDQTTDVAKTNIEPDKFSDDVLKVCILFDSVASARCAEDFLAHVDQRARDAFMLVQAKAQQLTDIANLIDAGDLRVFVEDVFSLDRAREAYAPAEQGKMRGKIALRVVE